MAWLNDDFMDDFNEEAILDESMFEEDDASLEEGGWEDDEDDGTDKWEDSDDDDTLSEADFIDTDYYDDQVEPTTVPNHDAEKDQYSKVDNPEVMKDENGTEEVEMESFTDWDDLF